jgi:hypothetical protein
MVNVPATILSRSSMLTSPSPPFPLMDWRSNPMPESCIDSKIWPGLLESLTRTCETPACCPMLRRLYLVSNAREAGGRVWIEIAPRDVGGNHGQSIPRTP